MTEQPKEVEDIMRESVDMSSLPIYPHKILADMPEEMCPPSYKGEETDIIKRMQHKLQMTWLTWSDIRKNENVSKLLVAKEDDDEDVFELKNVLLILFDRIGRILCDTDLLEEFKLGMPEFDPEKVIEEEFKSKEE